MGNGIRLLVELDDKGSAKIKKVKSNLRDLGDESSKQGSKWAKVWKRKGDAVDDVSKTVRKFTTSLPALLAGAGIGAMFGAGIKSGLAFTGQLETIKTQFKVIIGDTAKANKMFQETLEFSARTPFQMAEVAKARKMLVAFGQESLEALTITGDAAAAAGIQIDEMALVMGKISVGAFGEAFMRLAETGIATRQMLEGEGLTFDKGGSYTGSAAQAMATVQKIIKDRFGGMMAEQSKTWEGMISTMKDNWNILKGKLTEPLFEKLKPKILELTALFEKWMKTSAFDNFAQGISTAFDKLMAAGKIAIEVTKYIWQFKEGIGAAIGVLVAITVAQATYNAVMAVNPWTLLIMAIAAMVGWLVHMEKKTGMLSKAWANLKFGVMTAVNFMVSSFKTQIQIYAQVGKAVWAFKDVVWEVFKGLGQVVVDYYTALWNISKNTVLTIGDIFRTLGEGIKAAFSGNLDGVKQALKDMGEITTTGVKMNLDEIKNIGIGAFAGAGEAWGKVAALSSGEAFSAITEKNFNEWSAKQKELAANLAAELTAITASHSTGESAPAGVSAGVSVNRASSVGMFDAMKNAESEYNAWVIEQNAAALQRENQLADIYKEIWDESYLGMVDLTATYVGIMENRFADFATNVLTGAESLFDAFGNFMESMFNDFISSSARAASRWIFDQARMAIAKKSMEKITTAAAVAGSAQRTAAAATETAGTGAQQAQDQIGMATKVTKAHAHIPFVGALIAAVVIAGMLSAISSARKKRTGGLIGGVGSGSEDDQFIATSAGEYHMPRTAVSRYGVGFMDSVRTGQYQHGDGGGTTFQFNIQGGGDGLERDIEENVVPILERLVRQRRLVVT